MNLYEAMKSGSAITTTLDIPSAESGLSKAWILNAWGRSQPVWVRLLLVAAMSICVGWLDAVTGWEVSVFVFYAVPIAAAVWLVDLQVGLITALLGGCIWWAANRDENPYATEWGYSWAALNRLIYFTFVAVGVKAIRRKQEADEAQIKMLEEMRCLEQEIVAISEREQQRIGRDLHDGLCQQLAAIGCAAKALAEDLAAGEQQRDKDATRIESAIRTAVIEARSLARGIFPVHVDGSGLAVALGDLARTTERLTGAKILFEESGDSQVSQAEQSMHIYRIAQEAISNAVKHSGASLIKMTLSAEGGIIHFSVEDDGVGLPKDAYESRTGMGLRTMVYRARAIGAQFTTGERAGGGTKINVLLKEPKGAREV